MASEKQRASPLTRRAGSSAPQLPAARLGLPGRLWQVERVVGQRKKERRKPESDGQAWRLPNREKKSLSTHPSKFSLKPDHIRGNSPHAIRCNPTHANGALPASP